MARGRPREHDRGALLDHARKLWVEQGTSGLTIRALSERAGVGNGAIYNAFGSRSNLLARVWTREAELFLEYQRNAVAEAIATSDPQQGVVAAALAPASYAATNEEAARLLLAVQAKDLMNGELGPEELAEVQRLRGQLGDLIIGLAQAVWGRTDPRAVMLIKICVVDLPGRMLLSANRLDSELAHHALREAVLGITGSAPPQPNQ